MIVKDNNMICFEKPDELDEVHFDDDFDDEIDE
jgi:hypothetical protein